jgi:DnaJ-class molecular chaperone
MSLYKDLDITNNATDTDIKKAYRKLAMVNHPDKGGDPEKFKKISRAYSTLSNKEKRKQYDITGNADEKGTIPDFSKMFNMGGLGQMFSSDSGFTNIFNGGRGFKNMFNGNQKKPQHEVTPIIKDVHLTIKQAYEGCSYKYSPLEVYRNCNKCKGKGGSELKICDKCTGVGNIIHIRKIEGLGIIQQIRTDCPDCKGKGKTFLNICNECKGECQVLKKIAVTLNIKANHNFNTHIIYPKYGHEIKGIKGSLSFRIYTDDEKMFRRDRYDLVKIIELNLIQSLADYEFEILLPNGDTVLYESRNTIQNGQKVRIPNKGFQSPNDRGDLIIEFIVKLPELTHEEKLKIMDLGSIFNK